MVKVNNSSGPNPNSMNSVPKKEEFTVPSFKLQFAEIPKTAEKGMNEREVTQINNDPKMTALFKSKVQS